MLLLNMSVYINWDPIYLENLDWWPWNWTSVRCTIGWAGLFIADVASIGFCWTMGEFYIGLCFHCSISFMINVHIRGSIQATRGLHQGCPLSPYLFLNCAKAFSCMLYAAELTRLIWRVPFSSDIWVSHLLFPDTLRGLRHAGGDFFSLFNGFRSNLVTRNLIFHSVHMWHLLFGWRLRIYLGLLRSLLLIGSWIYLQWSGGSGGLFPMANG